MKHLSTVLERSEFADASPARDPIRIIAVASGKGGVGKTNVVANLGVALAQQGKRVFVFDADLGLGNMDILLGLVPRYSLHDVLKGHKTIDDIVISGPAGIRILPAASGVAALTTLTIEQQLQLHGEIEKLDSHADMLLIDTSTGISPNTCSFATAAQEIVVVVSPEPTSIADAYAMIKVLSNDYGEKRVRLLVNMARTALDAHAVYRKLSLVTQKFLNVSVDYLGGILYDDLLPAAVHRQRAVVEMYPRAVSSQEFTRLATQISQWPRPDHPKGSVQFFWQRLFEQPVAAAGVPACP